MIFGTGIDIIEVDRIKNSIQKYSGRFKKKFLLKRKSITAIPKRTQQNILPLALLLKKLS